MLPAIKNVPRQPPDRKVGLAQQQQHNASGYHQQANEHQRLSQVGHNSIAENKKIHFRTIFTRPNGLIAPLSTLSIRHCQVSVLAS